MDIKSEKEALLEYLDELLTFEASKLVGKCLKRFEICADREILRKNIKELIYEEMRDIKTIMRAYGDGVSTSQFHFVKKGE